SSDLHLDGYIEPLQAADGPLDPAKLEEVVAFTREKGAWVVPTMVLWETILGAADLESMLEYPELKYMPAEEVERWRSGYARRTGNPEFDAARARRIAEHRKTLLKALADGGVKILFGTDSPQVFSVSCFSIHREAVATADAGVRKLVILQSSTEVVGDYLSGTDNFGLVGPGHRADLVLLSANPLEGVSPVGGREGVMLRGRWFPEAEIQEKLREIG